MAGIDERGRNHRFGAAAPGARPEPPSLEGLLTTPQGPAGRRRLTLRRALAILGVLVLAGGAFMAGRYTAPAPPRPRVSELTVTATALPAGTRLTGADLRVITVQPDAGPPPPGTLSPAAATSLLGLFTRTAVPAGTFLERSLLAPSGAIPGPAQALVGLALKPGQLPVGGLAVGQQVLVIALPTTSQGTPLAPVQLGTTAVWFEQGPDSSGNTSVSVVVSGHLAARLAGYASRGEVALVATAGNGQP